MFKWFKRDKNKDKTQPTAPESTVVDDSALPVPVQPASDEEPAIDPEAAVNRQSVSLPDQPSTTIMDQASTAVSAGPASEDDTPPVVQEEPEKKKGFFSRLREKLSNTRTILNTRVDHLLLGIKEIDQDVLDELEEILITSDLGVTTTQALLKNVSEMVARKELTSAPKLKENLRAEMIRILTAPKADFDRQAKPHVIMVAGVNGVGKTTTIAKLANRFINENQKVLVVAGDTFRAAAVEQLDIWCRRVGADLIKQQAGADPSAVVFDGLRAAVTREVDVVIIDTAGRLHTKVNLMEELKKIKRVADRALPGAPHEILLVLDATTGQNAISQAKLFNEAVGVHQLVMTKLDGTAKGGILVAICHELNLPVRYIGLGEGMDDLRDFEPQAFVEAIF
ncbi:MAG: signal recognition particle-docking protein FtsY [Deltaproteobacteria bacterium]|nr:signal recognition particle-docking protein FtsY [Deltaproteobacteria bacterium]